MGTSTAPMNTFGLRLHSLLQRILWNSAGPRCAHVQSLWDRFGHRKRVVRFGGSLYCVDECLESALRKALVHMRPNRKSIVSHRLPLGLLLLSRQQVAPEQLTEALHAQRAAGRGKIGEWLVSLGFISEQQVTAALAKQWSCPVLRVDAPGSWGRYFPAIPLALLEHHSMAPVAFVEATATLHVAFADHVDYSVLYALEQMSGCHTEPCMALPALVENRIESIRKASEDTQITFECDSEASEFPRIVQSYCMRLTVREIKVNICDPYIWVRLFPAGRSPMDLLFHWHATARWYASRNLCGA